jgi:hypothetical protein
MISVYTTRSHLKDNQSPMISHYVPAYASAFSRAARLQAQDGFFSGWFDRSDQAKADQPSWMTPLVAVTPRLEQEFRADFLIEEMPPGMI